MRQAFYSPSSVMMWCSSSPKRDLAIVVFVPLSPLSSYPSTCSKHQHPVPSCISIVASRADQVWGVGPSWFGNSRRRSVPIMMGGARRFVAGPLSRLSTYSSLFQRWLGKIYSPNEIPFYFAITQESGILYVPRTKIPVTLCSPVLYFRKTFTMKLREIAI
jgi:hypothetical protein